MIRNYSRKKSDNNLKNNKERYRKLCNERQDIPLFMQAWWMDAVCIPYNKKWDVLIVEINNEIIGAMPYHYLIKFFHRIILLPIHTQYNGVWIKYPENQTEREKLCVEKKIMTSIVEQIDGLGISFFQQNFHKSITNWQPFYWKGFEQSTRYTYIISDISNKEIVFDNFHSFKQKHIKKAQRDLQVDFELSAEDFYKFHAKTLAQNKKKINYSEELFRSIFSEAIARQQGKIIAIRSKENDLLSATYIVWDRQSAYYLISAIDPDYKSSGASSLMVWEAILYLADKTKSFDFEGSMIKNVAQSFEEFGAKQTPYFIISKYNLFFSIYLYFKNYKRN